MLSQSRRAKVIGALRMNYFAAIEFLYGLRTFGAKFGLENTRRLAALAGNPHARLRFIHIAGTNGKGSTCAILESIYRAVGLRVGLFTSPHLVAFGERIQVNRQLISENDVARLVSEMQPLLAEFSREQHPTFFEVVTVMAMRYFAEQQCDLVIWETGLGGRLDATNIVTPLASVITNIGFDHQQWLGESLPQIAHEKAGIIKHRVPALTACDAPDAREIIQAKAREMSAPFTSISAFEISNFQFQIPLIGEHQRTNAALALATVNVLQSQIPVSEDALRTGFARVHWSGRLQLHTTASGQKWLLDGAHNPPSCVVLRAALDRHFPQPQPALLLGMLADKDCAQMCERLAPFARRIALAPAASARALPVAELHELCQRANPTAKITQHESVRAALKTLADEPFVLATGSLYIVGEVLELLGLSPSSARGERGLNEWAATK